MVSFFWDSQWVIMNDYLEQGRTIKGPYYTSELRRLHQEKRQKEARKKLTRGILLLQVNAPTHTSQFAMTAAIECGFEILLHPPYSDMAPSDFYLFPKLKSYFRGLQYGSNEGVIETVNEYLWDQENAFYFKG